MKELRNLFIVTALVLVLTTVTPAAAEISKKIEYGKDCKMGHQVGHGPGHVFGPKWKETLTDSQKTQINRMHLTVMKSMSVLNVRLKLKKAELNVLIVKDNPDTKAIHRKIDEVLELKREIMRIKYDHKVEMRGVLTPDQRVSFDMGLLKKTHGKGQKHHK